MKTYFFLWLNSFVIISLILCIKSSWPLQLAAGSSGGPGRRESGDGAERDNRMLYGICNCHRLYSTMEERVHNRFIEDNELSMQRCVWRLTTLIERAERSLDVLCFAIHDVEADVCAAIKRGVRVRVVLSARRGRLRSMAYRLTHRGAIVRWLPATCRLQINLFLVDCCQQPPPPALPLAPVALVSMHDRDESTLVEDARTALIYGGCRAQHYIIEFEAQWFKLGPDVTG